MSIQQRVLFFMLKIGEWGVAMEIPVLISIIAGLSGILLGWWGKASQAKKDARTDGLQDGALRVDVEYIKRGVDAVQVEQKVQGKMYSELNERVIRVEESTKQAHRRIDELK